MVKPPTYEDLLRRVADLEKELNAVKAPCREDYRLMLESISDTIILTDDQGRMTYVCPNSSIIFGRSRDEMQACATIQGVLGGLPCDPGEVRRLGEIRNIEWAVKSASGRERILLINVKAIDKNGPGILYAMRDITERAAAEKSLEENESLFNKLVSLSPGGIYQTDVDGHCVYANEKWLDMAGLSFDEARGRGWINGIHPDDREGVRRAWYKMVDSKGQWSHEYRFQNRSGKITWVYGLATAVLDDAGGIAGYLGINIDITDIKSASERVAESESKYRTLFENMAQGVFYQRADGKLTDYNQNALEMFGLTADQFLGRTSLHPEWRVIHEDGSDFPGEEHPSMVALKTGKPVLDTIAGVYNPVKQDFVWLNINAIPQFRPGDITPYQVFVTLHDITALRQVEKELRHTRKMESIGTLAGGIAHDFNNLLYMILGNAEMALEDMPRWHPAHDSLKEIRSAGLRATAIVKQLLDFSRKSNDELKETGAVAVIKEGLKFIRSTLPATIDITASLPDDEIIVMAEPVMINQVLVNICTNAAQAMGAAGGGIEICVTRTGLPPGQRRRTGLGSGTYLQIIVRDSGPGIDPKLINRIFDPYFTTKEVGEGSGMGLSIVHGIVKNLNGAVLADSPTGRGAAFTILIPEVDKGIDRGEQAYAGLARGNETLLFIDDEEKIVKLCRQLLSRLGYTVVTSTDPADALRTFQSDPDRFDLVVTDVTMPGMTGIELFKTMKQSGQVTPTIICTGHSDLIDEIKAGQLGFAALLMKPVSKATMAATIRNVLDRTRA